MGWVVTIAKRFLNYFLNVLNMLSQKMIEINRLATIEQGIRDAEEDAS